MIFSSTSRPGVGGFSDDDVKRLMSKFDKLFTKPKTTSTGFKSELKNNIEVIKNSSDSSIKKTDAIVKAYESYLYNNNKQAFDEYWLVRKENPIWKPEKGNIAYDAETRLGDKLKESGIDIKLILNKMGDDILSVNKPNPHYSIIIKGLLYPKLEDNVNFYNLVKTGAPLDLKSRVFQQSHDSNYSIWSRDWGEGVKDDYAGNYLYGYIGKGYLNSTDTYLKLAAGAAQELSDIKSMGFIEADWKAFKSSLAGNYFDNPGDSKMIQDGIEAYKQRNR